MNASRPSEPSVTVGCFSESLAPLSPGTVVVAIDVIRATTTAVTALAHGRRIFPAASITAAVRLAADLENPVLAGELGGVQPYGFDMQNSPSAMEELPSEDRPIILLSTSGTRLIAEAAAKASTYAACLRNARAQARHLIELGVDVLLLGADSRGEFRLEDQLCAARIGGLLLDAGHTATDETARLIERLRDAPTDTLLGSRSAQYLRDTGQERDLDFVLSHVEDLDTVYRVEDRELHGHDLRASRP